jgi:hypothetical protein
MALGRNGFARSFGVCVASAAALAAQAKEAVAVTVLGEVGVHRVEQAAPMTLLDACIAAQASRAAEMRALVVVRCSEHGTLLLRVDMRAMLTTGRTDQNLVLQNGDVLLVPSKALGAAKLTDLAVVDAVVQAAAPERLPGGARASLVAWRLLGEPDATKRQAQLLELGKLGEHGVAIVAPLTKALGGDAAIARDAATALGMLGAAAAPALGELQRGVASADTQFAARCRAAVRTIERAVAERPAAAPKPDATPRK